MKREIRFEDYLDKHGELTYTNRGVSMLPMLRQNRDLITIRRKGPERLRKYDVALYVRPPHNYILHRVVEVQEKGYVILGDNCARKEVGIKEEQIIGVLTSFTRGGKTITADNHLYRFYSHAVVFLYPIRRARIRLAVAAKRTVKRILRR